MANNPRVAKLGQALVKQGTIDEHQLASALANSDQWGLRLGKVLVRLRLLRESAVVKAISDATGFQMIDLAANPPEAAARPYLDEAFCRERGVFPLAVREKAGSRTLFLAMADPTDVEAIDLAAARCRGRVKPFVASEQIIEKAIDRFYRGADVALVVEEESTISEMDEMKLVDVNGRTMAGVMAPVISLRDEAAAEAAAEADDNRSPSQRMAQRFAGEQQGRAASPPVGRYPSPPLPPVSSSMRAPDPLADLLGRGPSGGSGPNLAAFEARLSGVEQNLAALLKAQETSTALVRAIAELLIEKQYISSDEVRARASRR